MDEIIEWLMMKKYSYFYLCYFCDTMRFYRNRCIVISYNWEYNNFNIYVNLKYLIKI